MTRSLLQHQQEVIDKLSSGKILVGGVGSGKSRTALYYYYYNERIDNRLKKLYIITTAKKRDDKEWLKECAIFDLLNTDIVVDSWNNIGKYIRIKDAFFIFDEQRLVGSGAWVKSFHEIVKTNTWLLLSATPGDTWMDYIPVFIANKLYKNRTEFIRRHVVWNTFTKYPKIDRYIEVGRLMKCRQEVTVMMKYRIRTKHHIKYVPVSYDMDLYRMAAIERWHVYKQEPIKDVGELCHVLRRIVNSDPRRTYTIECLMRKHPRLIIFYNFNYERDMLIELAERTRTPLGEWNGHKHQEIPDTEKWLYIVQYMAGAEGWECITTDAMIFYSQHYSYKIRTQAAGRIDRLNTPFNDLYYYHLISSSSIDRDIRKAFDNKQSFNENIYTFS